MKNLTLVVCLIFLTQLSCQATAPITENTENIGTQPNIILIVADDMGLTDLGAFGSEINTPNLDKLAFEGVRLTNFHASPQCAPTRSILMSGTDNHTAGMGSMFGDRNIKGSYGNRVGYEGYLHPRVASLPERLRDAGYHTYMAGKWHLGGDEEKKPTARGFEKAFALIAGSASHMEMRSNGRPAVYRENGKVLEALPDDFYSTNTHTSKMIEYINANQKDDKPFFGFLALTSPHWPLQVPAESKDRYAGQYDQGYDALRAQRIKRAEALGVIPKVDPTLFDNVGDNWNELTPEQQRYSSRTMELYAAMVDNMDNNVGRLTSYLEEIGELDNTLIFFMSDNGAESDFEYNPTFGNALVNQGYYDNSYENLGNKNSWAYYGPGWAQAAMAPFRLFKGYLNEGGTRVSAFAYHPKLAASASMDNQYLSIMDVMPTFLEIANAQFDPTQYNGREVVPMEGRSFSGVLQGEDEIIYGPEDIIAKELHGQRSLLRGDYKIVWEQRIAQVYWADEEPAHWKTWRLYNLENDPSEQSDLSASMPELKQELVTLWDQWADKNNVRLDIEPYWAQPLVEGIEKLGRPKGQYYPVPN